MIIAEKEVFQLIFTADEIGVMARAVGRLVRNARDDKKRNERRGWKPGVGAVDITDKTIAIGEQLYARFRETSPPRKSPS